MLKLPYKITKLALLLVIGFALGVALKDEKIGHWNNFSIKPIDYYQIKTNITHENNLVSYYVVNGYGTELMRCQFIRGWINDQKSHYIKYIKLNMHGDISVYFYPDTYEYSRENPSFTHDFNDGLFDQYLYQFSLNSDYESTDGCGL